MTSGRRPLEPRITSSKGTAPMQSVFASAVCLPALTSCHEYGRSRSFILHFPISLAWVATVSASRPVPFLSAGLSLGTEGCVSAVCTESCNQRKEYYIKCVRHPGGTSQPIQLARIGCHRESRETAVSPCGVRRQAQLLRCASHLLVPNPRRGAAAHIVLCSRHLAEAPLEKA